MRLTLRSIIGFSVWFCTMCAGIQVHGQCTFDFQTIIQDTQSVTVQVEVAGLTNSDLAGSQSLCAINLAFRHNYLGDLTVELISPAGQSVQLIGPITDQISPTNLTSWNISFLQCGFPAAPDAGFTAQWNNNQAWQILSNYTGSYYPSAGCLEDFDTGQANGTWRLVLTDNDAPQTGELISVELIFCDNTGISCTLCEADAGRFADPILSICEGEPVAQTAFEPVYLVDTPDFILYDYAYLLSTDGVGHVTLNQINTTALPIGVYTVCGLSFERTQTAPLMQQIDTMTLDEIRDAFAQQEIPFCADITETCLTLEILDLPDSAYVDASLCPGESMTVGGQTFSATGTYVIDIPVAGACDSVVILDLEVTQLVPRIDQADTISCENEITQLDATGSTAGPSASFTWTTATGMIMSGANQPVATIRGPGTYLLTIEEGACTEQLSWEVITDKSFPFVAIDDALIDCNNLNVTLQTAVFPPQVTYDWSGPGGFVSADPEPIVSEGGVYFLNVTDITGCSATASVTVEVDTTRPVVSFLEVKDCATERVQLCLLPPADVYTYNWSGPNAFTSVNRVIWVADPGMYSGTITLPNGCSASDSIFVDADFTIPDVTVDVSDDTLNCTEQITLTAMTTMPGVTYHWVGPGGFTSGNASVVTSVAGQYVIEVTGSNECVNRDTVVIARGDDLFDVTLFPDTLTCNIDTAIIGVLPNAIVQSFSWSGNGVMDSVPFIRVTAPGVYAVQIVDTAQCVVNALVEVVSDMVPINFNPVHDTVSCSEPIGQLSFVPNQPVFTINWEAPDQSMSADSILVADVPGVYRLTITGANGCPRTRAVRLYADTLAPVVFVSAGNIGCLGSTDITTVAVDPALTYLWTGPQGFVSAEPAITVGEAGLYTLTATAANGCSTVIDQPIVADTTRPVIAIDSVGVDCDANAAYLSVVVDDPLSSISWFRNGVFVDTSVVITPSQAGQYVVEVTGSNQCISADTVDFPGFGRPAFMVTTDILTCAVDTVVLTASSPDPEVTYEWYDGTGILSTDTFLIVDQSGTYGVRALVENGCPGDTLVAVPIDTIPPVAVVGGPDPVPCSPGDIVVLSAAGSVGDALIYQWSTTTGAIFSGMSEVSASVAGQGLYHLLVTDETNGCSGRDSLLVQPASMLTGIRFTAIPECAGNGMGSIIISGVDGANSPLQYRLDDGPLVSTATFTGLSMGTYALTARDSFGCSVDTVVTVNETAAGSFVDLGMDIEAIIGDVVELSATLTVDSAAVTGISWEPPLPCNTCLQNTIMPVETQTFRITVSDTFGCVISDEITVFVQERAKFFMPNVFSPNGDGVNDELVLYLHPGVARVHAFRIFDRWGDQVHGAINVVPEDPTLRWDGRLKGTLLNPGVYAYLLDVELLTGRRQIFSGDITLIR
ncbi:MAG: gliding motility-associated C-terminal domain-containing protein [Saprospiraceae bacterium]|nr:gliding motility-associated C-terminal domain-containing protein [Saprospiraceae bacterium]